MFNTIDNPIKKPSKKSKIMLSGKYLININAIPIRITPIGIADKF